MSCYIKLYFHLLVLIAFSFLLSCSINNSDKLPHEKALSKNEILLDSLIQKINKLNVKEAPSEFVILYIKTIEILDRLPDTNKLQGDIRLELIPSLDEVGAYEEAIKQSWEYMDYVELNDKIGESHNLNIYGLLAGMYNAIGNSDSAYIVYELAIRQSKYHPDELWLSSQLNNMGLYFSNLGKYDSALVHFNLADSVLNAHPDKTVYWKSFHGVVRSNLANLYFDMGEYEKAKTLYQEMFHFYKKLGREKGIIYSGISIARSNIEQGNCEGQEELLNNMRMDLTPQSFSQKLDFNLYLWEAYVNLYLCNKDSSSAFLYQQKGIHLKDSLQKIKEKAIVKSNSQIRNFTSVHFNQQLQIEKAEHEKEKRKARFRLWAIIIIGLGATLVLIILFIYYKQRIRFQKEKTNFQNANFLLSEQKLKSQEQENKLADFELKSKKNDLISLAMALSQKREQADEMYLLVNQIEKLKGKQRQKEFLGLKEYLKNQRYVDEELKHFQQNIDVLSSAFYNKLESRFPELSKTEMKLSGFIKLGLSTSQIAQLQNITPKSVKMSRYRLKKKLSLNADQNLDDFLQSL